MRGHMMPPPLRLSDIRCKWFPYRVAMASKSSAEVRNERPNEF